jgi:hypothetical protein
VGTAPTSFELTLARELVRKRQWVDDAPALADGDHRAENPAMPLGVEHRVVHELRRANDRILVHEHGGQDGLFSVFRVWRLPVPEWITAE